MRIGFAGTPEFARVALAALLAAGHEVAVVLTQPDRPAGRGLKLAASAVKTFALTNHVPVLQPRGLKLDGRYADDAAAAHAALVDARLDVLVVAAYGLILPPWLLELPRAGSLNIHASLLPRWRGAAPIHRAIEAGDAETGITIMQMDAGLDTGAMLRVEALPIAADDTTGRLHDRLAALGGRLIGEALERLSNGALQPVPQPADGITYARKVEKREAAIDWHAGAAQIERRLRAFDPFPGATARLDGETIKCWQGRTEPDLAAASGTVVVSDIPAEADASAAPGSIVVADARGIAVACGDGLLWLTQLQRAGGRRLDAATFARQGSPWVGRRFETG